MSNAKSPWGTIGNWAAEAEREEEEEREAAAKAAASQPPAATFPSLKESVTKHKKKTKMTLHQFTTMQQQPPPAALTRDEMLRLPTGPRDRSPDEMLQPARLGGGFSNYGPRTGSNPGRRSYEEDDRRPQSRVSEFSNQPSRADEVDDWGSTKKTQNLADSNQPRPGGKYASLGGGRANEVDNWASGKKPVAAVSRSSGFVRPEGDRWARNEQGFGSGFVRPEGERWTRNEQRPVLDLKRSEVEEAGVVKVNKPNPFGAARPREEVLAEKGLDWKKLDLEIEVKKQGSSVSGGSRPTSSQSSRVASPHSSRSEVATGLEGTSEVAVKRKPKVNPFGDAKPREILLEEKGLDWKKIDLDLEHRRVQRPETEEEKNLKEEIERLKNELLQKTGEDQTTMQDLIVQREKDLQLLVRQLDDKVRYSQRNFDRQSSGLIKGAGYNERPPSRPGAYDEPRAGYSERPSSRGGFPDRPSSRHGAYDDPRSERPPSRPGAYEDSRSAFSQGSYQEPRAVDFNERPHSRGAGNSWTGSSDDRRSFQGGGGRGFSGSRDMDRSGSRW